MLLGRFNLFRWLPDPSLSDDENYMDLVLLVTRNSACSNQGHMGSLIVDPRIVERTGRSPDMSETVKGMERRLYGCVIGAATNQPLFRESDSDIHAEITALGQACRNRHSTDGCTAYITMPPCKRCFAALVTFGIKRIVSRKLPPQQIRDTAANNGIEVLELDSETRRTQMERINRLTNLTKTDEELMRITAQRKRRREEKKRGAVSGKIPEAEDDLKELRTVGIIPLQTPR